MSDGSREENKAFQRRSVPIRTYRECESLLGVKFLPCLLEEDSSARKQLEPGKYLLHSTDWGKPHCIGLSISELNTVLEGAACFKYRAGCWTGLWPKGLMVVLARCSELHSLHSKLLSSRAGA